MARSRRLSSGSDPLTRAPPSAPFWKPAAELRSRPAIRGVGAWQAWHFATKSGRIFVSKYSTPEIWPGDKRVEVRITKGRRKYLSDNDNHRRAEVVYVLC